MCQKTMTAPSATKQHTRSTGFKKAEHTRAAATMYMRERSLSGSLAWKCDKAHKKGVEVHPLPGARTVGRCGVKECGPKKQWVSVESEV